MSKNAYIVAINALLFFFIINAVNGVVIRTNSLLDKVFASLLFGLIILAVPFLLGFFKVTINFWSKFLLTTVICFAFFFLIYQKVIGIGSIVGSTINLGFGLNPIVLDDVGTLIVAAVLSALLSAGLQVLGNHK